MIDNIKKMIGMDNTADRIVKDPSIEATSMSYQDMVTDFIKPSPASVHEAPVTDAPIVRYQQDDQLQPRRPQSQSDFVLPVGIKIVENVIPNSQEVIDYLKANAEWNPSTILANNAASSLRTSSTTFVPFIAYSNDPVIEAMNRAVWVELDKYAKDYLTGFFAVEDVSIQHYEPGQSYGMHVDHGRGTERIISAVLYLNEVPEGGGTYFELFDFLVEPTPGRLVIFPSNYCYSHEALPPVGGDKYAAAYWALG